MMTNSISDGKKEVRDGHDSIRDDGADSADKFTTQPHDFAGHPFTKNLTVGWMAARLLFILAVAFLFGCGSVTVDENGEQFHWANCKGKVRVEEFKFTCYHPVTFLGS